MINLQIVDDHKLVATSLRKLIDESGIAKVSGVYHDLKSCREGLLKNCPDVLLLDIGLPDGDGVDFCKEITKSYPELKVIMLTTYKEFSIAKRAMHNGALGYILKNAEVEEMLAGIEAVNRGIEFRCEEIDILLLKKEEEDKDKEGKDKVNIWVSDREKEVLRYINDGFTTKVIADLMCIDSETVKSHRKNLFIKLKPKNMAELIKKGYEMKLIW